MSKFLPIYLFLIILSTLISCEKEADIPLPEGEPKLVVYSYLNPSDSVIKVEVTKSIPYFGSANNNENKAVEDALVELFSNDLTVQVPFNSATGNYIIPHNSNFPIVAGQTYSLKVTAPGNFNCSATTAIPSKSADNIEVEIDSNLRNSDGYGEIQYRVISRWQDIVGVQNYYQHSLRISYGPNFDQGNFTSCINVLNDDSRDGNKITKTCTTTFFYNPDFASEYGLNGTVFLLTIDKAYYKYHESFYRYDEENPFSEPVQIYTNIEGGLGCFGSYLEQRISL